MSDAPISAFRPVPRTGVIYVTTEAQKLGFPKAVLPATVPDGQAGDPEMRGIGQLVELVARIAASARSQPSED